jgi:hypothetical protein
VAGFAQLYSNIFTYPLYIGICLLLMLVYSFIYMLLAVYVERINPGEFGVAQPWYFIFQKVCCKQKNMSTVIPVDSLHNLDKTNNKIGAATHWIELDSMVNGMSPSVSTINLTKVSWVISQNYILIYF